MALCFLFAYTCHSSFIDDPSSDGIVANGEDDILILGHPYRYTLRLKNAVESALSFHIKFIQSFGISKVAMSNHQKLIQDFG